jgi:hypothetical protein
MNRLPGGAIDPAAEPVFDHGGRGEVGVAGGFRVGGKVVTGDLDGPADVAARGHFQLLAPPQHVQDLEHDSNVCDDACDESAYG